MLTVGFVQNNETNAKSLSLTNVNKPYCQHYTLPSSSPISKIVTIHTPTHMDTYTHTKILTLYIFTCIIQNTQNQHNPGQVLRWLTTANSNPIIFLIFLAIMKMNTCHSHTKQRKSFLLTTFFIIDDRNNRISYIFNKNYQLFLIKKTCIFKHVFYHPI